MSDEQSERGFKVEDRRRFSASGEPRSDVPAEEDKEDKEVPPAAGPAQGTDSHLPEITFSTFLFSLSTQALILLGEIEGAQAPEPADLPAAKQLIDILGILQAKTKGNLDADEAALLDHILYDLRMKYVQRTRRK